MYRERKTERDLRSVIFLVDSYCKGLRGGGGLAKSWSQKRGQRH